MKYFTLNNHYSSVLATITTLIALLVLAGCDNNSNNGSAVAPAPAPNARYEITTTNLTTGQPLSPLAVLIHDNSAQAFTIGQPASAGLEQLAESGDNSQFLTQMNAVVETSGAAPLGPGASETLTLELNTNDPSGMHLTVVTMLVNTNDAITAVNAASIAELAVDESMTFSTISYDTGTEANTETAATIPGPAGGGEGFNATRDDISDQVTMHGGVVTVNDGLSSSSLTQQHRWDNPVTRIRIIRTQ